MSLRDRLAEIYGDGLEAQAARYTAVLEEFALLYGPGEVWLFRAPGRVNLIGEHTDYNGGYVLPVALAEDIVLALRPRQDGWLHLHNCEAEFAPFAFAIGPEISRGEAGEWRNYVQGVGQTMARLLKRPLAGFAGLVSAKAPLGVPRGAGLSSSSALTVVMAVALATVNGWRPETAEFVQFCSEAEWYVGTRGGIMDQFIAVTGQKDHALFLDCRPPYQTEAVPLPPEVALLVVNSGVKHQNTRGHFNQRVAACRAGVGLLRAAFPGISLLRDVENVAWPELERLLPESITAEALLARGIELGDLPGLTAEAALQVRACCRHVWSENWRVRAAVTAMETADVTQLGQLLTEAHLSARDDYKISCPEVEQLVAILAAQAEVAGARLTGAGWGGCVVALVDGEAVMAVAEQTVQQYQAATGITAGAFICRPGPGAGLVVRMEIGD
jgi:galactokinase